MPSSRWAAAQPSARARKPGRIKRARVDHDSSGRVISVSIIRKPLSLVGRLPYAFSFGDLNERGGAGAKGDTVSVLEHAVVSDPTLPLSAVREPAAVSVLQHAVVSDRSSAIAVGPGPVTWTKAYLHRVALADGICGLIAGALTKMNS